MINEIQIASYCCSDGKDIENYAAAMADITQTWEIHHRKGLKYSREDLIKKRKYYVRPAEELIFLTKSEHTKLHMKGRKRTVEHAENISKSKKGSNHPFYGKKLTAEWCENLSNSRKGRHWYNNGIENKFTYDCPEGFVKGRLIKWKLSSPNK